MNGGEAGPAEGIDRRALRAELGAELDSIEEVIALLEEVSGDVERVDGSRPPGGPAGEGPRHVLATIAGRLAAARNRVRETRDRLEAWVDRLRDAGDPAAEDLEALQAALGAIVLDRLEPARATLRTLLDEYLPGVTA